jgi:hypothetical protein
MATPEDRADGNWVEDAAAGAAFQGILAAGGLARRRGSAATIRPAAGHLTFERALKGIDEVLGDVEAPLADTVTLGDPTVTTPSADGCPSVSAAVAYPLPDETGEQ